MNAGCRCLFRQVMTKKTVLRNITSVTGAHNSLNSLSNHLKHIYLKKKLRFHNSFCLSTSSARRKEDDDDNNGNNLKDEDETAYFDRFYAIVLEQSQSKKNYAVAQIKKRKISEVDKKRALQRWTFDQVVDVYVHNNTNRRRHVEFIYEALDRIIDLGLQRDIEVYKKLLMAFPQDGRMVGQTTWQVEFKHYPKQQDCALEVLDQMEENGLIPDDEFTDKIIELFGSESIVYRKIRREIYWGRKFNNANPYKLPFNLPDDPIELAVLGLKKMAVDLQNEISVWQTKDVENTYVVSAQSCNQKELLKKHKTDKPIYVEGGYKVWLRDTWLTYFVLRSDSDQALFADPVLDEEDEGLFHFETVFDSENPTEIMPRPSEHQQEDGTILGMCITGTGSKDSLIQWIRFLQESNPSLEQTPIVFTLQSPLDDEVLSIEPGESGGGNIKPV